MNITFNNQTKSITDWAKEYNINVGTLESRLKRGWNIEKSLTKNIRPLDNRSQTRLWKIWASAKYRCLNKNNDRFHRYGGRGIKFCDRWLDFNNFKSDMEKLYNEHIKLHGQYNTSIDRINNNGDYCPENCKWSTRKEQSNNMRRNRYVTINNQTKTVSEWCDIYNMPKENVYARIGSKKWDPVRAITTPIKVFNKLK